MADPQRLDTAHRGSWHPGKQSSRSFPLSSWIFPPLSSAPLIPVFSLSLPLPSPPPRLLFLRPPHVLAQLHLEALSSYLASTSASLLRRDVAVVAAVARAPRPLSLLSPCPPCSFVLPRPLSFLFFGVGFVGASDAPRSSPCAHHPRRSPLCLSFSLAPSSCYLLPCLPALRGAAYGDLEGTPRPGKGRAKPRKKRRKRGMVAPNYTTVLPQILDFTRSVLGF